MIQTHPGAAPVAQWLKLGAANAGGPVSIPSWGNKIPRAMQKKKRHTDIYPEIFMDEINTVEQELPLQKNMGASVHEGSFGNDGKDLKLDYGDGCTTLSVY